MKRPAARARVHLGLPLRLVVVGALAQLGAGGANGVDLGARRVRRDEDGQREAAARARRSARARPWLPADAVTSRAAHRRRPLADAQRRVERAPDLVRAGRLDDFELEVDVGAVSIREPLRSAKRRPQRRGPGCARPRRECRRARSAHYGAGFAASRLQDLRQASRKRRSRQHLVRPRRPGGGDQLGVDVRGETDGAQTRRGRRPLSAPRSSRWDPSWAVQIEDHQSRLQRLRLRDHLVGWWPRT